MDCTSINLVLCNDVLKNVYGHIGREKLKGRTVTKNNACYDLIIASINPTPEEIQIGKEVVSQRNINLFPVAQKRKKSKAA